MSHPVPKILTDALPPIEFIEEVCGIYFRSIVLCRGDLVPQHAHDHDHATYCGSGSARLWVNGEWREDVQAGHAVAIHAGDEHLFQALEEGTRLSCVHDVSSAASLKAKGF